MCTFVIIDDEKMIRYGIRYVLSERPEYKIIGEASTGLEGLHIIRTLRPDIAFVDIRMPNMNGLELARLVQKENLNCKIIILTAYSEFKHATDALRYGVSDYITKPINEQEVYSSIQRITKIKNENNLVCIEHPEDVAANKIVSELIAAHEDLHPLIKRVMFHVSKNFNQELSLHSLAKSANVSAAYLSRLFTREIGINLSKFINIFRIKIAQELLITSNYSVTEISLLIGYNSVQYFCTLFKKLTTISPQQYMYKNKNI